jgi:hypothetical protein
LKKQTKQIIVLLIAVALLGAAQYKYNIFSLLFPQISQGSVTCSGIGVIQGNNTAVATGTVTIAQGATVVASSTVTTASGWSVALNPGSYTGYWIATGYYPVFFSFTVPEDIGGTRTYTVGSILMYPISSKYSFTFANQTTILATNINAAVTNSTWKTHISYGASPYTLTVGANSPFSQVGFPQLSYSYPARGVIDGNYLIIYVSSNNIILNNPVWSTPSGLGKMYVYQWSSVTSGVGPNTSSISLTATGVTAGTYTWSIACYQYTNLAQIQANIAAVAAQGWTLTTYTLGAATMYVTVAA